MRRAILSVALATVASIAVAQVQSDVVVPQSSIVRAEDAGLRVHTNYFMRVPDPNLNPDVPPPAVIIETPASIACVYHLATSNPTGCNVATTTKHATGGTQTIVIVDAYDDSSAGADLKTFSTQFGLPNANFTKKYATGHKPADACATGWQGEEALDIQWAHAMAPKANIVLMEAASSSLVDMYAAVDAANAYIASHGGKGEISMSWGTGEYGGETTDDLHFLQPGVVYFASSGDAAGTIYPSASPWVVSTGGAKIVRDTSGNFVKQVGTNTCGAGCGGGKSSFEGRPGYQDGVSGVVGTKRGTPDIASDSSSESPVYVYDSSCYGGWLEVWGTSVATPTLAGVINSAGSFKSSSAAELQLMYDNMGDTTAYKDITSGSCDTHNAKTGYDLCTGVGRVRGKTLK